LTPEGFSRAFAAAIAAAKARVPQCRLYKPGLGPHTEDEQVRLAVAEMGLAPGDYAFGVPYPTAARRKCDLVLRFRPSAFFVEFKLFRPAGDNGKLNDQNLNHLLSPYEQDRSALTDCRKLRASGFIGRKFVGVIVYEWGQQPFGPACAAFEMLAHADGPLGPRIEAPFSDLVHPHHRMGHVALWEVMDA